MEQLAERVRDELQDELSGGLVGVSYYERDEVGHVYRSDWAAEKYEPEQIDEIVRDIQLEALGYASLEARQEQALHATVRVYDEMLDVALPLTEHRGIAFALDWDGDYRLRNAIRLADQVIEQSDYERTALA